MAWDLGVRFPNVLLSYLACIGCAGGRCWLIGVPRSLAVLLSPMHSIGRLGR
uniref:Uncharacterized protein n=1 Tax=Triticum urartu TaxID=4572 RepID=A0A8R7TH99_TRIUA